jgi:hypothetical protein
MTALLLAIDQAVGTFEDYMISALRAPPPPPNLPFF